MESYERQQHAMDMWENPGFFLSLDISGNLQQRLVEFINSQNPEYILALPHSGEHNDNPHIHAIFSSDTKLDAMRKRFKKAFPDVKGSGAYSLRLWDGRLKGAGSYLFHENTEPIINKGFKDDALKYMKEWNDHIQISKQAKKDGVDDDNAIKKGAKTHWEIIEEIRATCKKDNVINDDFQSYGMGTYEVFRDKHEVWAVMIRALEKYHVKAAEYELDRWFSTIIRMDQRAMTKVKARILEKYS